MLLTIEAHGDRPAEVITPGNRLAAEDCIERALQAGVPEHKIILFKRAEHHKVWREVNFQFTSNTVVRYSFTFDPEVY